MSEPVHVLNLRIVSSGDMSASITSSATNINEVVSYAVQAVFTGSPVGSLSLEGSNDNTTYTVISSSTAAVSAAGSYLVNVELPAYSYVRLVYTRTSGTGTLNATINAKRR